MLSKPSIKRDDRRVNKDGKKNLLRVNLQLEGEETIMELAQYKVMLMHSDSDIEEKESMPPIKNKMKLIVLN